MSFMNRNNRFLGDSWSLPIGFICSSGKCTRKFWQTFFLLKSPTLSPSSPQVSSLLKLVGITPPKFNIDTKHDGLENVSPFKYGYFRYPESVSMLALYIYIFIYRYTYLEPVCPLF